MALGLHWEWRAFGQLSETLRRRIDSLPALLPEPWQLTDCYLWAPGCAANIKLRAGDLKVKYFLEATAGLERWLEDEKDIYPFPLAASILSQVSAALAVALPPCASAAIHRDQFLALLAAAQPPVKLVIVEKVRQFYQLDLEGGLDPALVELAWIGAPQAVASVALEHAEVEPARRAREWLGPIGSRLYPMSYLQAIGAWAEGRRLEQVRRRPSFD